MVACKVIGIISGGFDPLHEGHVEYMREAKKQCDFLICIANNDDFLRRKKGYVAIPVNSRLNILEAIRYINHVIPSSSMDDTVCCDLQHLRNMYPGRHLIFFKGGDRRKDEIPEKDICNKLGIEIIDGLGKKITSSTEIWERSHGI